MTLRQFVDFCAALWRWWHGDGARPLWGAASVAGPAAAPPAPIPEPKEPVAMPKSVDKKPVKKSGARAAAIAGRVLAGQAVSWAEIETLAASVLAQAEKPAPAKASAKKVRASHV